MKTKFLAAFLTVILVSACADESRVPDAFVGTWQSDEALTLASLEKSDLITPTDSKVFTDNFFGDRVFIYKPTKYKAYWVGEEWTNVEQDDVWHSYDIVESGPDFVTLRYLATEYSEAQVKTWRIDGELIYVEEPRWGFNEYYRRID